MPTLWVLTTARLLSTHLGAGGRRLLGGGLQQAGQRVRLPRQLLQPPRLLLAQRLLGAVAVLRAHQRRTLDLGFALCSMRKRQKS